MFRVDGAGKLPLVYAFIDAAKKTGQAAVIAIVNISRDG
jgi:hypothetical protein